MLPGITSVKVGESDLLPVIVNDATVNLLSFPHSSADSEMNYSADVTVGADATDRTHVCDSYQRCVIHFKFSKNSNFYKGNWNKKSVGCRNLLIRNRKFLEVMFCIYFNIRAVLQ